MTSNTPQFSRGQRLRVAVKAILWFIPTGLWPSWGCWPSPGEGDAWFTTHLAQGGDLSENY